MSYRYSDTDRTNMRWMETDYSVATLRTINLVSGKLRGLGRLKLSLGYPIAAIAGENGSGKSTLLAIAACAYHNSRDGYKLAGRQNTYHTFSDFFIQSRGESTPQGIEIGYEFLHDNWHRHPNGPGWQTRKKSVGGRWNNYDKRVPRNVLYFGVQRVVPHYERSAHKSYRGQFTNESLPEAVQRKICEIAGRVLGKTYDTFEKHTHSKYSLPITKSRNVRYSGFNMGAGESAVFEILVALFEAGRGALLVIDEIELGLHEQAQARFVYELKHLCDDTHCQIICSTHSHVVLNALPPEGRIFVESREETLVTTGISANYACGMLRGANSDEINVFVEDNVARDIVQLGFPSRLRGRVNVTPIGSSNAVLRTLASRYLENKGNCLCILDGDKRLDDNRNKERAANYAEGKFRTSMEEMNDWIADRLTYLPSNETPERWLIGFCLKQSDKTQLASLWREEKDGNIDAWLTAALREQSHHELFHLSTLVQLSVDHIVADMVRFLCNSRPELWDQIIKLVEIRLSQ